MTARDSEGRIEQTSGGGGNVRRMVPRTVDDMGPRVDVFETPKPDEMAKRYPSEPESRKTAKAFVEEFKAAGGYEFAHEFEDDLVQSLEDMLDKMDHLPGDDRGEPLVWRR